VSFDFFPYEQAREMERAAQRPSLSAEPGFWTGFAPGAAALTMQGLAKTARAVDLLGAVGPIVEDALTGGTTAQDRYFQEHDDLFNRAVDYWTPDAGSVGTAGRVVGGLVPNLATFAISPGLMAATGGESVTEDLLRKGVALPKAAGAGAIEATGLAIGAAVPIFGRNLIERIAAGAGTNVAQGVATRGAQRKVLAGTGEEGAYNPWDAEGMVLDILMGAGFGAIAHLGAPEKGAKKPPALDSAQKDALLVANQARHMEDTTAPGTPATAADLDAHVAAMRKAVDDVLNGRSAEVGQIVQDATFRPDEARIAAQEELRQAVSDEARKVIVDEVARSERVEAAEQVPGFLRSAEDLLALKGKDALPREMADPLREAIRIAKKPGFQRSATEKRTLDAFMQGRGADLLMGEIPAPEPPPLPKAKPADGAPKGEGAAEPAAPDPIVQEAQAHIAQRPDLAYVGDDGKPVKVADELTRAGEDVAKARGASGIFQTAAACFLGAL
jgi:hypothetical protein